MIKKLIVIALYAFEWALGIFKLFVCPVSFHFHILGMCGFLSLPGEETDALSCLRGGAGK